MQNIYSQGKKNFRVRALTPFLYFLHLGCKHLYKLKCICVQNVHTSISLTARNRLGHQNIGPLEAGGSPIS